MHGHPSPLACPEGVVRASLASYYFVTDASEKAKEGHSARFFVDGFPEPSR